MKKLTIGSFAKELNISVETIRFYQRKGLLKIPLTKNGQYRQYGPTDLERIRLILNAKDIGFKLDEIKEILDALEQKIKKVDLSKIVENKIASLESQRGRITKALSTLSEIRSSLISSGTLPRHCKIKIA